MEKERKMEGKGSKEGRKNGIVKVVVVVVVVVVATATIKVVTVVVVVVVVRETTTVSLFIMNNRNLLPSLPLPFSSKQEHFQQRETNRCSDSI